jgi:hypothetical protein
MRIGTHSAFFEVEGGALLKRFVRVVLGQSHWKGIEVGVDDLVWIILKRQDDFEGAFDSSRRVDTSDQLLADG